jgi:hypothetical protein
MANSIRSSRVAELGMCAVPIFAASQTEIAE